jgi:hypothetical protein
MAKHRVVALVLLLGAGFPGLMETATTGRAAGTYLRATLSHGRHNNINCIRFLAVFCNAILNVYNSTN